MWNNTNRDFLFGEAAQPFRKKRQPRGGIVVHEVSSDGTSELDMIDLSSAVDHIYTSIDAGSSLRFEVYRAFPGGELGPMIGSYNS